MRIKSLKTTNLNTINIIKMVTNQQEKLLKETNRKNNEIVKTINLCYKALKNNGKIIYIGTFIPQRISALCDSGIFTCNRDNKKIIHEIMNSINIVKKTLTKKTAISDLKKYRLTSKDVVIGLSWSGTTKYTIAGLEYAHKQKAKTIAITSKQESLLAKQGDVVIHFEIDPKIIMDSNKIQSKNAYKYILNIIATSLSIKMNESLPPNDLSNSKIQMNSIKFLAYVTSITNNKAKLLFNKSGQNLSVAVVMHYLKIRKSSAIKLLEHYNNSLFATFNDKDNKLTKLQKINGQKAIVVLDTTNGYIKISWLTLANKTIKSISKIIKH